MINGCVNIDLHSKLSFNTGAACAVEIHKHERWKPAYSAVYFVPGNGLATPEANASLDVIMAHISHVYSRIFGVVVISFPE